MTETIKRPHGPNLTSQVHRYTISLEDTSTTVIDKIAYSIGASPQHVARVQAKMRCYDRTSGCFNTGFDTTFRNGNNHFCSTCVYGPGGQDTECGILYDRAQSPELTQGHKVLKIPPFMSPNHTPSPNSFISSLIAGTIEIAARRGIPVIIGTRFDWQNQQEFGLFCMDDKELDDRSIGIESILAQSEFRIPGRYTISEVLTNDRIRIVAKNPFLHEGEQKYLLESPEQKIKFLTWLFISRNNNSLLRQMRNADMDSFTRYVQQMRILFASGIPNNHLQVLEEESKKWQFQEYLPGPTDHAVSLRTVCDMHGRTLFASLLINPLQHRQMRLIASPSDETPLQRIFIGEDRNTVSTRSASILLTDPRSPLFLDTYSIVSNYAQGSREMVLDGMPTQDLWARDIMLRSGIDPNSSTPPEDLLCVSGRLSIAKRNNWPYCGIDWIPTVTGKFAFIELNGIPSLNHKMVQGATPDMSQYELQMLMMSNVKDYSGS